MPKNSDNPGTSDRGQLAASRNPYLPTQRPYEDPYEPPPSPSHGFTGPELRAAGIERKLGYRALAAAIESVDAQAATAAASYAAAEKGRRG